MESFDTFPWHAHFDTGLPEIDVQHRKLVLLLNQLAEQIATRVDVNVLDHVFDSLVAYASYHFDTEEQIWHEWLGDQSVEAGHHETHASFLRDIERLRSRLNEESPESLAEEILEYLSKWLVHHILSSDRYMSCVVHASMQGLSGEAAHTKARKQMNGENKVLLELVLSLYASHSRNMVRLIRELNAHKQSDFELRKASFALEQAHQRLVSILDGMNAGVYVADMQTYEILFVNALGRQLVGEDVVGKTCWKALHKGMTGPCHFCTNHQLLQSNGDAGNSVIWEHYNPALDRWFQLHDQAIRWDDGRYVRMEIAIDITTRKKTEVALQTSEARYRMLFESSRDALIIVAPPDWRFQAGNPAMVKLFGADSLHPLLGLTPAEVSPDYQPDGQRSSEKALHALNVAMTEGVWQGEWLHRRLDGREILCQVTLNRIEVDAGVQVQGTVRDISAAKQQQLKLERMAHYDDLTGLPNRALLADRMRQAMAQARRRGHIMIVAYIDLDGFKEVNDHYGHDAGDRLLITVSNRMAAVLRESDTLARLGGDEFVVTLSDLSCIESCTTTLSRLLDSVSRPIFDDGKSLHVSASIGVTFYPQEDVSDPDQLLRQADVAMYQAKLSGKNRFSFFDVAHDYEVRDFNQHLSRIEQGLKHQEFVIYYQPLVNLRSGTVVGLEALIRWLHPQRDLLLPMEFMPTIKGHPIEIELGDWIFDTVLDQIVAWQKQGLSIPVSVNVGTLQLQHPDFASSLEHKLSLRPEVTPSLLQMDIQESSALADLDYLIEIISHCRTLGIEFTLDDFGTGCSSLTNLKRLPIKTLKIDRIFIGNMLVNQEDRAILEGVLSLASVFKRVAVAEGVESAEHGAELLKMGCELAQGNGIAMPMRAEEVVDWVATWRTSA